MTSRLDNIIKRNRRGRVPSERIVVMVGIGLFLLLVIGLLVFTDLGIPGGTPAPGPGPEPRARDEVDGVMIRSVPHDAARR